VAPEPGVTARDDLWWHCPVQSLKRLAHGCPGDWRNAYAILASLPRAIAATAGIPHSDVAGIVG